MYHHRIWVICAAAVVAIWSGSLHGQETHGDVNLYGAPEGIFLQSKASWPDIGAKLGNSAQAQFIVRNSTNSTLLAVKANGDVGIRTSLPGAGGIYEAPLTIHTTGYHGTFIKLSNSEPSYKMSGLWMQENTANAGWLFGVDNIGNAGFRYGTGGSETAAISAAKDGVVGLAIDTTGKVGIGTRTPTQVLHVVGSAVVTGDLDVKGNIAARWQDLAEWVPAIEELPAGTVVVLDRERSNHVVSSFAPYDTAVAGVVSDRPGIILGEGGEAKVRVATTGRVRVKVDARRSAIGIGDLLVTSAEGGMAMRSAPSAIGGVAMHRPGTVIGKALEPLGGGVGEILVLLSLQ